MVDDPSALAHTARAIIDSNLYMTLATADAAGRPWPTPVYFAPVNYRELIWVSSPEARHSQNVSVRPEIGIVVFDSRVAVNRGQAVYISASAELVPAAELDRCLEEFSHSCQERGGSPWVRQDVAPAAGLSLYRATAAEYWLLDSHDRRIPVRPDLDPA